LNPPRRALRCPILRRHSPGWQAILVQRIALGALRRTSRTRWDLASDGIQVVASVCGGRRGRPGRPELATAVQPTPDPARVERQIEALRRRTKLGLSGLRPPAHAASTVHRVLVRRQFEPAELDGSSDRTRDPSLRARAAWRPGPRRRQEAGRIPPGGGWRIHGRGERPRALRGLGFDYIHSAVDDHSRLAYSEICSDERGPRSGVLVPRQRVLCRVRIVVHRVSPTMRSPTEIPSHSAPPSSRARRPALIRPHDRNQRQSRALQPDPARGMA